MAKIRISTSLKNVKGFIFEDHLNKKIVPKMRRFKQIIKKQILN